MYDSDPFNVSVSVISNIGDLTINAGSIINDCGNAGWGSYAIDSLSGSGEPTVIINGGLVESTLYRAIRLFCNSTTLNNTLIINGGTVSSLTIMLFGYKTQILTAIKEPSTLMGKFLMVHMKVHQDTHSMA